MSEAIEDYTVLIRKVSNYSERMIAFGQLHQMQGLYNLANAMPLNRQNTLYNILKAFDAVAGKLVNYLKTVS